MAKRLLQILFGPSVVTVRDRFVAEELMSALENSERGYVVRVGK